MDRIAILAIGPIDEGLLAPAENQPERVDLRRMGTIGEAHRIVDDGFVPALIIVSERWPDEIQAEDLRRLQSLSPLARIWRIAGPWCEGEMRTAPPPAQTLRSYWHQMQVRLADDLARYASGIPPRSILPLTATEEEVTLALAERHPEKPGLVVVCATEGEAGMALLDACEACGHSGVWIKDVKSAAVSQACAVLCDLRADELPNATLVLRLQKSFGEAPVLAVVGFPRPHDVAAAKASGFATVISKPLGLSDLVYTLGHLARG
jgi:CheY-like chemotaxis protein